MSTSEDEETAFVYTSDDETAEASKFDFLEEQESESAQTQQKNYIVLTESDIRLQIENTIKELCSVLCVSKYEASILLRHYNWTCSTVHDAWFADEVAVRKHVGLLDENVLESKRNDCGICFESYPREMIRHARCGHSFCCECWGVYISTSVSDGPVCLTLRCPEPSCVVAVPDDLIYELVSEEDKKKYDRFLLRSYVENNKKRKWCPAPGCEFAIDFVAGDENLDVSCKCCHTFCWNCGVEKHRPVECRTVEKWMGKNSSDSENEKWKKAFTKPCPKCKRDIEKNMGCMHMTCAAPCRFSFCWLCLQDWNKHNFGGTCNRYKENPESDETRTLKEDLQKYQHYYERWAENEKSKQIAINDLKNIEDKLVEKIKLIQDQCQSQVDFLIETWQQIVECRRVLKWTYAYGFYLPKEEHVKKQLFEYVQGEAESALERLHHFAEREVKKFSAPGTPSPGEFGSFRRKLIELTKATKHYFENLVRSLESGLSDVISKRHWRSDGASTSEPKRICARERYIKPQSDLQGSWTCQFCDFKDNPDDAMACRACHL